jgi:tetratricopeptide (TPR) repeat protein
MGDTGVGYGSERAIRVFVSSTFRDMQAEREELVKRVFPQIRRRCEQRGVGWSEVDLRWGVTDEQKAEGAVLPICLAEIDRSRPFFLGLLGQRYGWVPEELPDQLADQLPWLRELEGTSVTEMEVLHGVLNDPDAAGHAFFHLRDPGYLATRSPEEQELLGEPVPENVAKLEALKDRVRTSGHPWADYADPAELGRQVLAELTALVDRLFPEEDAPDAARRDDDAHRAFGAARRAGHVERPAVAARLDEHAAGDGPPLLLTAEPGADLTPLVATWAEQRRSDDPGTPVLVHHVGATSDAADWRVLAGRLTVALARALGGEVPDLAALPDDAAGRRAVLFGALERFGASGRRAVVVVDGCELLLDVDGAPDLTWLPMQLPPGLRLVLTSASTRTTDEVLRREWAVAEVPPLDDAERRAFIASFLGRWSKGLDAVHVDRLAAAPQCGSPLFLRTVLDELRQHGDHFTLGEVLDRYLAAATTDDLLELVLARYEHDLEADRPGLVRDAMTALWSARRGLSEPELLDLLGDGEPLPGAVWSPLVLAAEDGLVTRSGLLGFATPLHRLAVEDRYLPTEEDRRAAAARLATYFATRPLTARVSEELPWAQLAAGDVDGLVRTLGDLDHLAVAYPHAPRDLRVLWARASDAGHSPVDAYRPVLDDPGAHPGAAWAVARLVTDAGHPTEALALNRFLVGHHRTGAAAGAERGPARLRASLLNLGAACWLQGDLDGAEPPLREAIELARAADDDVVLRGGLGNLGLVLRDRGALDAALPLFEEEADRCRAAGDLAGLQASLGNRAGLLRQQGRFDEARTTMAEQERIARSIGDAQGIAASLVAQGALAADTGDPTGALAAFEAYRAWAVDAGDLRAQIEALLNLSTTLRQLGRREEGAGCGVDAEALARRTGDGGLLARVLDAQARLASEEGRWPDVERLASEAALTARAADAPAALVLALGSLGTARRELGNLAGATEAAQEELAVAQQLGDPAAVATAQVNLGNIAIATNDLRGALGWYGAAEPALRDRGLAMVLVPLLNNRWQVHAALGDNSAAATDLVACTHQCVLAGAWQQALQVGQQAIQYLHGTGRAAEAGPVYDDLATAARTMGDDAALQQAVGDHALLVLGQGDLARAASMLDEQEAICRRIGHQVGLAACVGNRAILKRQQGDLPGALADVEEQLRLSQETGNGQGVLFATANRGELLGALGRVDEARRDLEWARQVAQQNGLAPMVAQLDQMIAALRGGGR